MVRRCCSTRCRPPRSIGKQRSTSRNGSRLTFIARFVQPFIWLLLLTLAVVGANRKRLALTDFLLVASFAYLGLYSARNVALFGLAAPIVLTRSAAPLVEAWARLSPKTIYHAKAVISQES